MWGAKHFWQSASCEHELRGAHRLQGNQLTELNPFVQDHQVVVFLLVWLLWSMGTCIQPSACTHTHTRVAVRYELMLPDAQHKIALLLLLSPFITQLDHSKLAMLA